MTTKFKQEIYETFKHTGLVMDVLDYIEKEQLLEARGILSQIIDEFRELHSTETLLYTPQEVEQHNSIVTQLLEMETIYSTFMLMLEENELLRK